MRARELKFWEKAHLPIPVMCQVSHVTCHVSPVTCHMSCVRFFFIFLFFFGLSGEASQGRVRYQRGLPRLVLINFCWYLHNMFDHVLSCLILVDLSCSWNILSNLGLAFIFWSFPGIYILEHSRNFILFWPLKKFNFCDHSRIFRVWTIVEFLCSVIFQNC